MPGRVDALCGYHGRYLRVDLSTGAGELIPLPGEVLRRYLGGSGLGTWLLCRESPRGIDPFDPRAPLAFVFSPLVGSPLTTSAKFAVLAKSPLTGRINDSLSSSHFAIAGKKTGVDALVIVGRAQGPTCLVIEPGRVELVDASDVWRLSSAAASARLQERLGARFRIAAIGEAGERQVRYATLSHDGRHAGRGGIGAVLGSKRLKGVAVWGDRRTTVAHPAELTAYSRDLSQRSLGPGTAKYRELGTVSNLLTFNRLQTLPTHNFRAASFAGAEALAPETLAGTHLRTRASCAACTIGCEHIFHPDGGASGGVRLEYENLFALGPLCGVADPDVVLEASRLCDELGIDTISAGGTIAFAMECAERGLLDAPGLRFGSGAAVLDVLRAIGRREGLGDLLAEGSRRAAAVIGRGAEDFATHVKGLELPGYEPRTLQTMALGFAVGTRGADHNRSGAYQVDFSAAVDRFHGSAEGAALAVETENEAALMDSLILCKFLRGVFDDRLAAMAEMLRLVTGWEVTQDELRQTAARIVTAKKWYNIRQGWTPAEDTLPKRFLTEAIRLGPGVRAPVGAVDDGSRSGQTFLTEQTAGTDSLRDAVLPESRLQAQIRAYNLARGWTPEGWVSARLLRELDILEEGSPCPSSSS
jgi:aldehyde:ferredoxin oxidoreductase